MRLKNEKNIRTLLIRTVLFVLIGLFLFFLVQELLLPKWYYPDCNLPESPTRTITGFYKEEKDSLEVIALGASTVLYSYYPMYVYDKFGVKSYNLASSRQPIQLTYFMLREVLKTQKPKVVIIDVSPLFFKESEEVRWRYVMDNIPISFNKLQMVHEFCLQNKDNNFWDALFPVLRYHDRWKELCERDWTDMVRNKRFYGKGHFLSSLQNGAYASVEEMNDLAQMRTQINRWSEERISCGKYSTVEEALHLYDFSIPENNLQWLIKIRNVCEENDINLVAVKVPSNDFWNGWSTLKYKEAKQVCEYLGITYYDMMYDYDIGIDWVTDTRDQGGHLNLLGAQKVSESLGSFLIQNYDLEKHKSQDWDEDLACYVRIKELALLQMENDLKSYISDLLKDYGSKVIFISVADDFYNNLMEEDVYALRSLGLQSNFQDAFRKSYLAVIENGSVKYESLSNGQIFYENKTENNHKYKIVSSGWLTESKAEIWIGNDQHAINSRGLNIVVYDDDLNMVLDSVCFDISAKEYVGMHSNRSSSEYLRQYENYVIEHEARR